MERIFPELTYEVEKTVQMYAKGKEKKEIADIKCRAIATINNQIQKAFEILEVRNGRELSIMYAKRIAIIKSRAFISRVKENSDTISRSVMSIILLGIFCYGMYSETSNIYNRGQRTETQARRRARRQDNIIEPFVA